MRLDAPWFRVVLSLDLLTWMVGAEWDHRKWWLYLCPLPTVIVQVQLRQRLCEHCRRPSDQPGKREYNPWMHYRCQPHLRARAKS